MSSPNVTLSSTPAQSQINPDDYFDLPKPLFFGNMIIACASGFLLNILLFYLISSKTPKEMRSYSRIMRIHCISDMIFDLVQSISGVQAAPIAGKVYNTIHTFEWQANPRMTRFAICLYFWSLLFAIAILPIDFYFRFLSVCRNRDMSNRQLYLLVFLAYAITWEHAFINTRNFLKIGPTYETREYTQELQQYWKGKIPPYSVTLMDSFETLINYALISLLNTFVYGVILYTFYRINKTLKENANVISHQRATSIHKQVARLLALQAVLPLVVICLPLMFIVFLTLIRFDSPHSGAIFNSFFVWLSAVKPLLTIWIVPRYRNHVRSLICGTPKFLSRPFAVSSTVFPQRRTSTVDGLSENRESRAERELRYAVSGEDQQTE